jgi:FdhD protein
MAEQPAVSGADGTAGASGGAAEAAVTDVTTALPRRPGPVTRVRARRFEAGSAGVPREDQLATEEPLEVRLGSRRVAVTMRTPGADFELAVGWLLSEGLLAGHGDVSAVRYCTDVELEPDERFNVVTVDLADPAADDGETGSRPFLVSSACGVCGRETLDDLHLRGYHRAPDGAVLDPVWLASLPERLSERQTVFERTGGLHAAGLFDVRTGDAVVVREDVGRHNAVDKVVGWALLADRLPLHGHVLVVSGRASYELCQKAVGAGVDALVAVSAPSSLAVRVAREFGLTLAAFARGGRVTVYAGEDRVRGA